MFSSCRFLKKEKSLGWWIKQKVLLKRSSRATLQHRKHCRSITPADVDREQRGAFVHDLNNGKPFPLYLCSRGATTARTTTPPQEKM